MMKLKKLLLHSIILSLFVGFYSCKPKHEEAQTIRVNRLLTNDSSDKKVEIPEITSFLIFLNNVDKKDVVSAGIAIDTFITTFANSDSVVCDSAYVHFQQFADSVEMYQNMKLDEDTIDYNVLFNGSKIPKKITGFVNKLNKNGFRMQLSDSIPTIIQDRKFLADKFGMLITENLKSYLNFKDKEYKTGFAEADSIIITPQELVDRILWYENFLILNERFVFRSECEKHLKAYTTYLVLGYAKTRFLKDENNFTVSEYFIQAFGYLYNKNAGSLSAKKLENVKNAIEQGSLHKLGEARKNLSIKGIIYNINP